MQDLECQNQTNLWVILGLNHNYLWLLSLETGKQEGSRQMFLLVPCFKGSYTSQKIAQKSNSFPQVEDSCSEWSRQGERPCKSPPSFKSYMSMLMLGRDTHLQHTDGHVQALNKIACWFPATPKHQECSSAVRHLMIHQNTTWLL